MVALNNDENFMITLTKILQKQFHNIKEED